MKDIYKWLLDFCSYYGVENGTEVDDDFNMFCNYEQVWVNKLSRWDYSLAELNEYIHYGLEDFNKDDGVPMTLKVILFNRYMHWSYGGNAEGFKKWYFTHYKNRLKGKKLSKGKRILNQYRLAFLEYRCDWQTVKDITPKQEYMHEIANAVDAEHGFDKPISESVMCRALAHADTHGYTIELVPDSDCAISKRIDGWSYHPEYKEIRERVLKFIKEEDWMYDAAEYIGRWAGKYVYLPYINSGEVPVVGLPHYIFVDNDNIEWFVDTEFQVKPRR